MRVGFVGLRISFDLMGRDGFYHGREEKFNVSRETSAA